MRGELVGSVLVLLALLILLSLLSPIKGQLTTALINGLRSLFGIGVWIVPLLLGGLGVWLALRDVTEGNTMSPWRLVGALGLFLVFEGCATLIAGIPNSAQEPLKARAAVLLGWLICGGPEHDPGPAPHHHRPADPGRDLGDGARRGDAG